MLAVAAGPVVKVSGAALQQAEGASRAGGSFEFLVWLPHACWRPAWAQHCTPTTVSYAWLLCRARAWLQMARNACRQHAAAARRSTAPTHRLAGAPSARALSVDHAGAISTLRAADSSMPGAGQSREGGQGAGRSVVQQGYSSTARTSAWPPRPLWCERSGLHPGLPPCAPLKDVTTEAEFPAAREQGQGYR